MTTQDLSKALAVHAAPQIPDALLAKRRQCRNTGATVSAVIVGLQFAAALVSDPPPAGSLYAAIAFLMGVGIVTIAGLQGGLLGWYVAKFKHPVAAWIGLTFLCNIAWHVVMRAGGIQ